MTHRDSWSTNISIKKTKTLWTQSPLSPTYLFVYFIAKLSWLVVIRRLGRDFVKANWFPRKIAGIVFTRIVCTNPTCHPGIWFAYFSKNSDLIIVFLKYRKWLSSKTDGLDKVVDEFSSTLMLSYVRVTRSVFAHLSSSRLMQVFVDILGIFTRISLVETALGHTRGKWTLPIIKWRRKLMFGMQQTTFICVINT